MARPGKPEAARFFVAILAAGADELACGCRALVDAFGPADRGGVARPFAGTSYYRDELGPAPLRAFLAFPGPFPTDRLAERKLVTNRLEEEVARTIGGALSRPVNLDPGYLTAAKLVLASAKNFSHRIHLRDGIYAEITLQYRKDGNGFAALPWTFPDYASGAYDAFFLELRHDLTRKERLRY